MAQQDAWLRLQIVSHNSSEDVYWRHASYIIAQLDGLYAGYKSVAEPQWVSHYQPATGCK
jgi:Phospholipase B